MAVDSCGLFAVSAKGIISFHVFEISYLLVVDDMPDLPEALRLKFSIPYYSVAAQISKTNVDSNHRPEVEGCFARIQEEHPT